MTYVSVNDQLYPATITGRLRDTSWNDRSSKEITVEMTYAQALEIFVNDIDWSIVEIMTHEEHVFNEEDGTITVVPREERSEYDNSDYSLAGDITDHRNGYVSVKMGKPTADELLALIEEAF